MPSNYDGHYTVDELLAEIRKIEAEVIRLRNLFNTHEHYVAQAGCDTTKALNADRGWTTDRL